MKASDICAKASGLTGGDRQNTHGDKALNHQNIAAMWNAYLSIRPDPATPLGALDAAHMMVLLKMARTQAGAFNLDDYVDMAGYAGVSGDIASGGADG